MAKSYNPVASNDKLIDIVEFLHQQSEPVSGTDISRATGYAHGTVMSHLANLVERKWIRQTAAGYEPGPRISGMYSAYKLGLENKVSKLQDELNSL